VKLLASWVAALVVALLAIWLLMRGEPAPVAPAAEAQADQSAAAPVSAAALERATLEPVRETTTPSGVSVSFTDVLDGAALTPRAVVQLDVEGARLLTAAADGSFAMPGEPSVVAASFAAHLPVLAVLRPQLGDSNLVVNVFPSTRISLEFEGCDASVLPPDAQITLGLHGGIPTLQRPDHGQAQNLFRPFLPWGRQHGRPDLTLAPAAWFNFEQAQEWREGALRHLKSRGVDGIGAVSAMTLAMLPLEHTVNGQPIVIEGAPAGLVYSWRTSLHLEQREPAAPEGQPTSVTPEGGRSGRFGVEAGGVTVKLAWAAAAGIRGRIPLEGLAGEILLPMARLSAVARGGPSAPVSGTLTGREIAAVDPVDGSFHFPNLAPGEYQLDAGWSIGKDLFISSARVHLTAGQQQDVGVCAVASGPPLRIEIELKDLLGRVMLPEEVFLDSVMARRLVRVHQTTQDAAEPSPFLELELPYTGVFRLHGLRPGFVFTTPGLEDPDAKLLRQGVSYVRSDVAEARITFPEVQETRMSCIVLAGTIPVTLRFEYPQDGLDRSYTLYLTHVQSGTQVPIGNLHQVLRPRERTTEGVMDLTPGAYEALLLSSMASHAKPGEVHHYSFTTLNVEADGRPVTLKLEPGLQARGPANAAELRTTDDSAFFMLRSIGGVEVRAKAVIVGRYGSDGNFAMHGVPRGAVLQQNRDPISWVVNESGILAPLR